MNSLEEKAEALRGIAQKYAPVLGAEDTNSLYTIAAALEDASYFIKALQTNVKNDQLLKEQNDYYFHIRQLPGQLRRLMGRSLPRF